MDEAEAQYRRADQFNSQLQDYINQSASRADYAIKNRQMSQARMDELLQLKSDAQNALRTLEEKREEIQYDYKKQMEQKQKSNMKHQINLRLLKPSLKKLHQLRVFKIPKQNINLKLQQIQRYHSRTKYAQSDKIWIIFQNK